MKNLILSAAVAVTTLFAGSALADDYRGAEKPSVQAMRSSRGTDAAERYAAKIREKVERTSSRSVAKFEKTNRALDRVRPKGDMVERRERSGRVDPAVATAERGSKSNKLMQGKIDKRGDIEQRNPNQRRFTVANDRTNLSNHKGPKTIVDIMRRKETLQFLGGTGVKVNCSQTGTCTADPI